MSWQSGGASVRGAQHQRLGLPVQDAIGWRQLPQGVALAVADGHGSAASSRSDVGARLAVDTALDLLASIASDPAAASPDDLARALVDTWRAAVRSHAAQHPLTPEPASLFPVYGTTVLAALATGQDLLLLQLGDGDLLLVSSASHVRRAWPRDARLLGGETTSLCMPEAWRELRIARRPLTVDPPALIILCTDGYSNSFRTERGFLRVGRDILSMVRAHGIQQVERDLGVWLEEASRLGSGDDSTAGLLYREAEALTTA
ncbi:MAG: PP2C family serine/threonine-protein phosphatase [Terriglobales bacterium]